MLEAPFAGTLRRILAREGGDASGRRRAGPGG
ncbi:hypothetical protein LNP24_20285 [Klebsiella pneumoniae subsp. pneumoniae]|nr:hypothetical protein [Klebsiella pneumoniae subsp. pneumoniae]